MRIPQYQEALRSAAREAVVESTADDPIVLTAADPDNAEAGPRMGLDVDAREAVELHRALTAWLKDHKSKHPAWHDQYRRHNPGGWERGPVVSQ